MAEFSKDQAYQFLKTVLCMESPPQTITQMNKLDFLNDIVRSWHNFVPFQNVMQLCLTKRESRLPTVQEIVADMMAGRGGVCLYHAVFCHVVLEALGYKTRYVVGEVWMPFDHVIVVVEDVVERGDLYLVEVGCGFFTAEAVSLDFSKKSEYVYLGGELEYKYTQVNNQIVRYHARGDDQRKSAQNVTGKWRLFYEFDMEYRDLAFLYSDEANVKSALVKVQPSHWALTQIIAMLFPGGITVAIKHKVLLVRDENGVNETALDEEEKLLKAFNKFFPKLDNTCVLEALAFADANAKTLN